MSLLFKTHTEWRHVGASQEESIPQKKNKYTTQVLHKNNWFVIGMNIVCNKLHFTNRNILLDKLNLSYRFFTKKWNGNCNGMNRQSLVKIILTTHFITYLGKTTSHFIFHPLKDQGSTKLGFSLVKNLGETLEKTICCVFGQAFGCCVHQKAGWTTFCHCKWLKK